MVLRYEPGQPRVVVDAAIYVMLGITTIFMILRFFCRIKRLGQFWWDDWILLGSWCLLVCSTGLLTEMLSRGYLDTNMTEPELFLLTKISHTCHLISLALSKTSFAVTLLRFVSKTQKYIVWFIIASIGIIFVVHIFLLWKPMCGLEAFWSLPGPCWDAKNPVIMNIVSSMYSAITDFVLAALPWKVFMSLQIKKDERVSLAVAMSVGAIAGVAGVMKSVQSIRTLNHLSPDFLYQMVIFWIFSLAEPNSTIIAASIPVLRVLFRDARTTYAGYSGSSPGAAGYLRSNNNNTFHASASRSRDPTRRSDHNRDADSDKSILNYAQGKLQGISRTTEVTVQYEGQSSTATRGKDEPEGESIEMQTRYPISAP